MVTNKCRNIIYAQPMKECNHMHATCLGFFLLMRVGWEVFGFMLFPMCSHQVPKWSSWSFKYFHCAPQDVPNSITLLSHIFCPKLSSFHLYMWATFLFYMFFLKLSSFHLDRHFIFQYKLLFQGPQVVMCWSK